MLNEVDVVATSLNLGKHFYLVYYQVYHLQPVHYQDQESHL